MRRIKLYEAEDKMIELISDNYNMLQCLSAFGIRLGFGDSTVSEVCKEQNVDTYTFLTVVNFIINGYAPKEVDEKISVETLLCYLRASHRYFLDFQIPSIREKLLESFPNIEDISSKMILKLYDEYAQDIKLHMKYEEKTLFPYVEALIRGEQMPKYNSDTYAKHHADTAVKFKELKNIIIKYMPQDGLTNNLLQAALYDIYNNEEWLANHSSVEDVLFVPAIRILEQKIIDKSTNEKISLVIGNRENEESLSDREREIIVCLVQGMSNKQVAENLCISVNTVITHRRNIAKKLQIHSLAGLTIYAFANGLVDKNIFF